VGASWGSHRCHPLVGDVGVNANEARGVEFDQGVARGLGATVAHDESPAGGRGGVEALMPGDELIATVWLEGEREESRVGRRGASVRVEVDVHPLPGRVHERQYSDDAGLLAENATAELTTQNPRLVDPSPRVLVVEARAEALDLNLHLDLGLLIDRGVTRPHDLRADLLGELLGRVAVGVGSNRR